MPNSPAVPASPGAVGGLDARGQLKANSKGVFGLPDTALDNAAAPQESAKITSTGKDLHLDGGTQLLLYPRRGQHEAKATVLKGKSVHLESGSQLLLVTQPAGTQTSSRQ